MAKKMSMLKFSFQLHKFISVLNLRKLRNLAATQREQPPEIPITPKTNPKLSQIGNQARHQI